MHAVKALVDGYGKRAAVSTAICAFLISFALVDGYCVAQGSGVLPGPGALAAMVAVAIVLFFLLALLFAHVALHGFPHARRSALLDRLGSARAAAIAGAVIAFCWFFVLLAVWPGCFNYDSGTGDLMQWAQIESGQLNAHHPVLHTLYMAFFLTNPLFGADFNAGVLASAAVQAAVVAAVLAWCIRELLEDGMGVCGYVLSSLYFALDPILGLFAFSTTKDVFFSAFLVCFCLQLWSLYRICEASGGRPSAGRLVRIGLTGFIVMSLRMNALAAIVLASPLLAALFKRARWRFLSAMACALIAVAVWLVPVSSLLGVQASPIGKWNALCVPVQQIAACSQDASVAPEDKARIAEALPGLEYREGLSDIARSAFIASPASSVELARLYASLGKAYPSVFVQAFLSHTIDAWSPFEVIDCYTRGQGAATDVFALGQQLPATRDSKLPALLGVLSYVASDAGFASVPVACLIASIAVYLFVLLVALAKVVALRDREGAVPIVVLAFLALSNFFGPCMLIRYFLYLFYALPLMVWIAARKPRPASTSGRYAPLRSR